MQHSSVAPAPAAREKPEERESGGDPAETKKAFREEGRGWGGASNATPYRGRPQRRLGGPAGLPRGITHDQGGGGARPQAAQLGGLASVQAGPSCLCGETVLSPGSPSLCEAVLMGISLPRV